MAVAIPAAEGRGVAYYGDFQTNEKVSIQAQGTLQSMAGLTTGIYITVCLCLILQRQRTGVETYGFQHDCRAHARFISDSTENLIRTLVVYSINRGIFTAVFQLAQFCNIHCDKEATSVRVDDYACPRILYINSLSALKTQYAAKDAEAHQGFPK